MPFEALVEEFLRFFSSLQDGCRLHYRWSDMGSPFWLAENTWVTGCKWGYFTPWTYTLKTNKYPLNLIVDSDEIFLFFWFSGTGFSFTLSKKIFFLVKLWRSTSGGFASLQAGEALKTEKTTKFQAGYNLIRPWTMSKFSLLLARWGHGIPRPPLTRFSSKTHALSIGNASCLRAPKRHHRGWFLRRLVDK